MQCIKPILRRYADKTTCGAPVNDIVPRRHASFCPRAPVDTESRNIVCVTVSCQRIEKSICRRIVALTRRAEYAGNRREEHKRIKRAVPAQTMQVPCALYFRPEHVLKSIPRLLEESAVIQNSGAVKDAAKRKIRLKHRRSVLLFSNISLAHSDAGAGCANC